jgi:ABC-type Fe3+/spermidine/putrescine transport system ATPase subunit
MLELVSISKQHGTIALDDVYCKVNQGDYFVLLGDLGAGKSLLLEIIAGFVKPDSGKILYCQKEISSLPVQKRNFGIVFKDFSIFPHLNVRDNIGYALQSKNMKKSDIVGRVAEIAGEMEIAHLLNRESNSLSCHELQRVALARALVVKPEILLLDEPFALIDTQYKGSLRRLLRQLNQKGQTIIHVTHEYEEAISMSNRVAIMHMGKVIQEGITQEVFKRPKSKFVANFIGINNFFPAELIKNGEGDYRKLIISDSVTFMIQTDRLRGQGFAVINDHAIMLSEIKQTSTGRNNFRGTITEICRSKYGIEALVDIGVSLTASISTELFEGLNLTEGKSVWVGVRADDILFLDEK